MLHIATETLRDQRDCLRKAREAPIIHKAKTSESLGIKKRDELNSPEARTLKEGFRTMIGSEKV